METYDQDGNRCDHDLSPAKFAGRTIITIADHEQAMKGREKRCELYLRTNKGHLNTILILNQQIDRIHKEYGEEIAALKAELQKWHDSRDGVMSSLKRIELLETSIEGDNEILRNINKIFKEKIIINFKKIEALLAANSRQADEIKRLRECLFPEQLKVIDALKQEEVKG